MVEYLFWFSRKGTAESPGPMNVSHDVTNSSSSCGAVTPDVKVDVSCTQCACGAMHAKQEKLLQAVQRKYVIEMYIVCMRNNAIMNGIHFAKIDF